jgi:hypothetical protein
VATDIVVVLSEDEHHTAAEGAWVLVVTRLHEPRHLRRRTTAFWCGVWWVRGCGVRSGVRGEVAGRGCGVRVRTFLSCAWWCTSDMMSQFETTVRLPRSSPARSRRRVNWVKRKGQALEA